MSIENPPEEVTEIRRRLYPEDGDTLTVEGEERGKLYEQLRQVEDRALSYFRLNIWGMGEYRQSMHTAHMLFLDADGSYPDHAAFDVPRDGEGRLVEDSDEYQAYREAVTAYIEHDHGRVGIPAHKLGSNDGWLVTPAECQGALEAWEQYVDDEHEGDYAAAAEVMDPNEPGYWLRWIQFLRVASDSGGFRVW
jgi:hypothetical protein